MNLDRGELEHAIQEAAGVRAAVEVRGNEVVLSGLVRTDGEREVALEIASELAPEATIIDDLEISAVLPSELGNLGVSEVEGGSFSGAQPGTSDYAIEPGDFTDQAIHTNPKTGSGPSGTAAEDDEHIAEGEEVYVPPTDPVRRSDSEFLGGFQTTAMDDDRPVTSEVVGGPADEGIADAIRLELLQDAATTDLEIEVEVVEAVARLRGTVQDMDDAENAVAVAERVPGVREVRDELEVRAV